MRHVDCMLHRLTGNCTAIMPTSAMPQTKNIFRVAVSTHPQAKFFLESNGSNDAQWLDATQKQALRESLDGVTNGRHQPI